MCPQSEKKHFLVLNREIRTINWLWFPMVSGFDQERGRNQSCLCLLSTEPWSSCLTQRERRRERLKEGRQTLSWWKINGQIGQVSTWLPTMTTLINNICQSCQLTLTQRWGLRNQSCVSSVQMNSPSRIQKMPASDSFAYCCLMNIFI